MNHSNGIGLRLALRKAAVAIEAHAIRSILDLEMCQSDFDVLELLLRAGPLPVNTLGKQIFLTSGSITTAIDRLEKRQMVRRTWQEQDKRVCLVELTPPGLEAIQKAFREYAEMMDRATSGLNKNEREVLIRLLTKLSPAADNASITEKPEPRREQRVKAEAVTPASISQPAVEEVGFTGFFGLD
jgi:MarR family 2-MHQ and catechol resistance regulon transcriptional repressor